LAAVLLLAVVPEIASAGIVVLRAAITVVPDRSEVDKFTLKAQLILPAGTVVDPVSTGLVIRIGDFEQALTGFTQKGGRYIFSARVPGVRKVTLSQRPSPPGADIVLDVIAKGANLTLSPIENPVTFAVELGAASAIVWRYAEDQARGTKRVLKLPSRPIADADGDGVTGRAGDCDDADPMIRPGVADVPNNGVDENCDRIDANGPILAIVAPASGDVVSGSTVSVSGSIGSATELACDGQPTSATGPTFSVSVPLREGRNPVTCVARNAEGGLASATAVVFRDSAPPTVQVESPTDGAVVFLPSVSVSGRVNDVATGTIGPDDVAVTCNGQPALVRNRTFQVVGVPLNIGTNQLTCQAVDHAGNVSAVAAVDVVRDVPIGQRIEVVSGDKQSGAATSELAESLVVRLVAEDGTPRSERSVVFRVTRGGGVFVDGSDGDRSMAVQTDENGLASVRFRLGGRAAAGAHRVSATATGFAGAADFSATAVAGPPSKLLVVAGDNQTGVVGARLPLPFVAYLVDVAGNPIAGSTVTFAVSAGDGSFEGEPTVQSVTDADGRAQAVLQLGALPGRENNVVTATIAALPDDAAMFTASGAVPGRLDETRFEGIVVDNAGAPVPGAQVSVIGAPGQATTDPQGRFLLQPIPVGRIFLFVDARTSPRPERFPMLEFEVITVQGIANSLGMPIALPAIDVAGGEICGGAAECVLPMADVPGAVLRIAPNSVTFPGGAHTGEITFTQVHLDKVPMMPPNASLLLPAWTIQPPGAHFDPPAHVTIPNTTGLAPGEQIDLYQFDHDLFEFISVGTGTVSDDGALISSDPGAGPTSAGWGGGPPPPPEPTCVSKPKECQVCRKGKIVPRENGTRCADAERVYMSSEGIAVSIDQTCDGQCQSGKCAPKNPEGYSVKEIRNALAAAFPAAMGSWCIPAGTFRSGLQAKLLQNGVVVICLPNPDASGAMYVNSNVMELYPRAFTRPGALRPGVVFHELLHGPGGDFGHIPTHQQVPFGGPIHPTDKPYGCEEKCFGGTGGGNPSACQ